MKPWKTIVSLRKAYVAIGKLALARQLSGLINEVDLRQVLDLENS